jgi:putative endonuclease
MARHGDGLPKAGLPKAAPLKAAPRVAQQKREAHPGKLVAFHLGISAESRAAVFLIAKGFRILARRWKSPVGEIDIVAPRRHLLVFVEVKARASLDEAAESVNARQQRRIAAAAGVWLAANPDDSVKDMRFDAILVAPGKLPRHIAAAFETT